MVEIALFAWFGLLAAIVASGVLGGTINTAGMLTHRFETDRRTAPERLTVLVVTLAYAGFYVLTALRASKPALPEIPDEVLLVLVGTNGMYLAGKVYDLKARGG